LLLFIFFCLSLRSLLNKSTEERSSKFDFYSHCAKYQNIVTLDERARSTWLLKSSNQLQWLGFGLPVSPVGCDRDQTLGLRSIIPLQTALCSQSEGEKQCFLATHLEYRAFHFRASRASLCDFLRVSAAQHKRNLWPVDNPLFL
jgi:hypothetical protein